MKVFFLILVLFAPLSAIAGFLGEFCEPEDESYLLKSEMKITKQSHESGAALSFTRTDADGDDVDMVLKEGQDFDLKVGPITNETSHEEEVKCEDGHASRLSSGASDIEFAFRFHEEKDLSKSLRKKTRNGILKTTLSCQWSAEEKPCVENKLSKRF